MCGIAHHFLALTLVDLGRADEALSPLTVAVVAARARGKDAELGELLRTLGALEPSGVACTTLRAEQAAALGRHDAAAELLAPALDAAPSDPFLLRAAALVAVARGAAAVDAGAAVVAALRATPLCPIVRAAARRLDLVAAADTVPSRVEEIR
jgi:hypothetical protein